MNPFGYCTNLLSHDTKSALPLRLLRLVRSSTSPGHCTNLLVQISCTWSRKYRAGTMLLLQNIHRSFADPLLIQISLATARNPLATARNPLATARNSLHLMTPKRPCRLSTSGRLCLQTCVWSYPCSSPSLLQSCPNSQTTKTSQRQLRYGSVGTLFVCLDHSVRRERRNGVCSNCCS